MKNPLPARATNAAALTKPFQFCAYQDSNQAMHKVLQVVPGLPIECAALPASLFLDAALEVIRSHCDEHKSGSLWAAFNLIEVAKGLVDSIGGAG